MDIRRGGPAIVLSNLYVACRLAETISGKSAESTSLGRATREGSIEVAFESDEATTGGPRGKMAKVAARAGSVERIHGFEPLSGRASVLRSRDLCSK